MDYLRNAEGATATEVYSFGARSNAPVATPIAWTELSREVRFDFCNFANIPGRLKRLRKGPLEAFHSTRQKVSKVMFEYVGYRGKSPGLPAHRQKIKNQEAVQA